VPTDFTLPSLGENIASGDVLRVLVKPGDTLAKEQTVLELETDKATIEVPSSVAGVVQDIKVKAGDKVKPGQAILSVDEAGAAERKAAPAAKAERSEEAAAPSAAPPPAPKPADQKVPDVQPDIQVQVRQTKPDKPGVKDEGPATETPSRGQKVVDISRGARQPEPSAAPSAAPEAPPVPAAPSVRRMARELGVEISQVAGTGSSGRISADDVKEHARRLVTGAVRAGGAPAEPLPDFSRWGDVERQPLRAVRRKTAEHLTAAWRTIPHVTQHDVADVTGLEELRARYAKKVEEAGGSLTVTAIAVKVVASALKVFPQFNSSIDLGNEELILKKYVNIGIAVDTDRGLLVPVIRDVDTKSIMQVAIELPQLAEKARSRKIALEEMQGACFSISNLGGIGGSFFTPIVNAPEVAILGISRARTEPVYRDGQFVPRLMLPLSLSYDHRAIDGADGARFLRWIIEALEQPFVLALHG
jgi:pyruvate dehydrogenase E2 component (dihydrolipoamide acetyltransferase)